MATVEMKTAGNEGDQEEKILPRSEEDDLPVVNETSGNLNFSELTPCHFGISIQSFTSGLSSNCKDKLLKAQIKSRRRSSVGVRGSPETNSLIRFIAQQRMKTPKPSQTPEHVRSSPFLPRVASTLRKKMASFQNLMDVEENGASDPVPAQDNDTGGCIKTRDYLSDGNSCGGGKENNPPMTPTPSKRRRLGPLEGCSVEIREANAPILNSSLKEQEDGVFELQSPSRPLPDDPASAPQHSSPFHISSHPSLLEMKHTGEDDSTRTSAVKKKKVRFGGPLSPEFFDKNLPPSTPLQKGATPARALTPGGSLKLRSVLKTPQRSESKTPRSHPGLSSPTVFGASPVLTLSHNLRMMSDREESEEADVKIVFPSMEEIDSAVMSDTECTWEAQSMNLNTAFHDKSLLQTVTESDNKPSAASLMNVLDESTSYPEEERQPEAGVENPTPVQSSNRRKKRGPEQEPSSEAPARSSSRKRKQPEESEPVKRSTRSAAKLASGKMKVKSTATRQWKKDVDRSLYSSRSYASKNPTLSPITERLSFTSQFAPTQQTLSLICTSSNQETRLNPESADNTQVKGDLAVTNALETASEESVTSPKSSKDSGTGKEDRRLPGPVVRRTGLKKRKVTAPNTMISEEPQDQTGGKLEEHCEEHCEDHTTTSSEVSTPSKKAVPEQEEVDSEEPGAYADTPCTDSDRKSECHAPTSDCPTSADDPNNTESAQRKAKRGRRSSVNSSVLQKQQKHSEEQQTSHEVDEKGQGAQAAIQQENIQSSSDSQEKGGLVGGEFAPWQSDFNFEDVFKPIASREHRSVRRSLRNQSNSEHNSSSAGLAWLPRTSPGSCKDTSRKSRGRRRAALPVQPLLPEETQDVS